MKPAVLVVLFLLILSVSGYSLNVAKPYNKRNVSDIVMQKDRHVSYSMQGVNYSVTLSDRRVNMSRSKAVIDPEEYCFSRETIKAVRSLTPTMENSMCQVCYYLGKDAVINTLNRTVIQYNQGLPTTYRYVPGVRNNFLFEDMGGYFFVNLSKYRNVRLEGDDGRVSVVNLSGSLFFYV